jgi:hypothetical protein
LVVPYFDTAYFERNAFRELVGVKAVANAHVYAEPFAAVDR